MHTSPQYRKMAEECFQWAATALNDEVRANYLSSAQVWLQAASRLDGGLSVRGAVMPFAKRDDGKFSPRQARSETGVECGPPTKAS